VDYLMRRSVPLTLLRGLIAGVVISAIFAAGFYFRGALPSLAASHTLATGDGANQPAPGSYPLLAQAQRLIEEHFLRPLPERTALEYGAIRGLITTLGDRQTFFIEPPVAASESNVLAGVYGGIGVLLKRDDQARFRLYPFPNSPAARAGVRDGDILLTVNGQDIPLTTPSDAADQLLRGEVKDGSGVRIIVERNEGITAEFFILFETIEVPSVIWRVLAEASDYGYIQILRFTARTPEELNNALADLRDAEVKGLILDLRNNPGGLLLESIQVASAFLPDDALVLSERTKNGTKEYPVSNSEKISQKELDIPLIVLVNEGSASAAELVAGALRDNRRALTIGQKTYGKWSIQLIFQLADKSSIHITTGEFFPPSGTPLDGIGMTPDIAMIPDQNGREVEIGEAIRELRKKTG